ncbi:MAG: DUF4358 domain-containing protein, partial [Clostridiales bacterium]|nr:DUF4358 domain-containing protein [Clostridiales bacterium]
IILALCLVVFIARDLQGDTVSDAPMAEVQAAVVSAAGYGDAVPAENRMVKRYYGLNVQDYDGVVLYAPEDNMDANELLLVRLADVSQSEDVEAAILERQQTQLNSFEGYAAEQTKLVQDYVLEIRGNYIFYMVGENVAQAQEAFLSCL